MIHTSTKNATDLISGKKPETELSYEEQQFFVAIQPELNKTMLNPAPITIDKILEYSKNKAQQ